MPKLGKDGIPYIEMAFDEKMGSYVVKRTGCWIVSVTPKIFNDRVMLTHVDEYPGTCSGGWCYDKGQAAFIAADLWDPIQDPRPLGYKKEAFFDERFWERNKDG